MGYTSGNDAAVKLGATSYGFAKWELNFDSGNKIFFAFGSAFQRTLEGGKGGRVTLTGPYDEGNMVLVMGQTYELHLMLTAALELIVTGRVADGNIGTEIAQGGDPAGISVNFDTDGSFALAFTAPS
jgi:hypothetical protein